MKTKEKLIPELRFPEFTDEWEEKKLGEIAEVYSGGTPSTKEKSYWNGDILWVTPTDVTSSRKYLSNTEKKITKLGLEKSSAKLLPKNSILMTSRATIGEVVINKEPVTTNQGFKSFVLRDNYYYEFIYYLLKMYKQIFLRLSNGSTFLELPMTDTKDVKVKLPDFPEQEKIGNFFYKIDKKLDLQRERIEELKDYKKAMMQRIFDREIRFKDEDGSEYPEWEEDTISYFINNEYLRLIKSNELQKFIGDRIYLSTSSIIGDRIVEIESTITYNNRPSRAQMIPLENSVWFAKMKNSLKVFLSDKTSENKYILSTGFYGFLPNNSKVDSKYIKQLFLSSFFDKQKNLYSEGTSMSAIKDDHFNFIKLRIPSLPEQEKIANFLSAIDKKIELEEEKLEEFEKLKKGLMQRMFI